MNIRQKLQLLDHLTAAEQVLVDYILQSPKEFMSLRPKEIAQKTFVSVPTLYRLVHKLNLSGVNDLKMQLQLSLQSEKVHQVDNIDFPILATDTHYEVMLHLREVYERTLDDSLDLADPETLVRVIKKMAQAQVIDIYTSSANIFFAENFQFQMMEINQTVNVPKDDYLKGLTASNSDKRHYAIVISFGGRGSSLRKFCRILKKNQVSILLITSTQNPLIELADEVIYMASSENHYNKISSFSTRLTLLYLLDTLYSLYFQLHYDENLAFKRQSYERMRKRSDD